MATTRSRSYVDGTLVASWYQPHGDCGYCTTHSGSITLTAGNHTVLYRHQELGGGDNYRLLWLPPNAAAASRDDFTVRVEVCNATYAAHETNCKKYTNPGNGAIVYKPTGLLHDYGETGKMKFGLLSGSYMHNRQGGVLRKQMGGFTDEIDAATGRFTWHTANFKGVISTLDGIKINSFERSYSHDYACNNSGWYGPVLDGVCRIWGNPIGEMMFETMRYFAGATAPEPEYTYTDAGSDDATLNMPEVTNWKDPYKSVAAGGLGNLACAKPFETVISDINPEYDSNLPGGAWGGAPTGALPSTLSGLDVGAPRRYDVGQRGRRHAERLHRPGRCSHRRRADAEDGFEFRQHPRPQPGRADQGRQLLLRERCVLRQHERHQPDRQRHAESADVRCRGRLAAAAHHVPDRLGHDDAGSVREVRWRKQHRSERRIPVDRPDRRLLRREDRQHPRRADRCDDQRRPCLREVPYQLRGHRAGQRP